MYAEIIIIQMEIFQRIIQARKRTNLTQAKLADLLHITRASCSHWESGISIPSVAYLSRLAVVLDVSFEWLATGRGEMEVNERIRKMEVGYGPFSKDQLVEQQEIQSLFFKLKMDQRASLLTFMRTIAISSR